MLKKSYIPLVLVGIGCFLLGAAAIIAAAYFMLKHHASSGWVDRPRDVTVAAELPLHVNLNEEFDMTLTIFNGRTDRPFNVSSVEIADFFITGIEILEFIPEPKRVEIKDANDEEFASAIAHYDLSIPPRGNFLMTIKINPITQGVIFGNIDIYEGEGWISAYVQTLVERPPSTAADEQANL